MSERKPSEGGVGWRAVLAEKESLQKENSQSNGID